MWLFKTLLAVQDNIQADGNEKSSVSNIRGAWIGAPIASTFLGQISTPDWKLLVRKNMAAEVAFLTYI